MPDAKKFNPNYAEPSTQYTNAYPFSSIVFPENVPVLGSDLNEMQAMFNQKAADILVKALCSNNPESYAFNDSYASGVAGSDGGYWIPVYYLEKQDSVEILGYFVNKARTESYPVTLTVSAENTNSSIYLKAEPVIYAGDDDTGEGLTNSIKSNHISGISAGGSLSNYLKENDFDESVNRRAGYTFELVSTLPEDVSGCSYILIYDGENWIYPSYISMFDNSRSQKDFLKIQSIVGKPWFLNEEDLQSLTSGVHDFVLTPWNVTKELYTTTSANDSMRGSLSLGSEGLDAPYFDVPVCTPGEKTIDMVELYQVYGDGPVFTITFDGLIESTLKKQRWLFYWNKRFPSAIICASFSTDTPSQYTIVGHFEVGRWPEANQYQDSELPNPDDVQSLILAQCALKFSQDAGGAYQEQFEWTAGLVPTLKSTAVSEKTKSLGYVDYDGQNVWVMGNTQSIYDALCPVILLGENPADMQTYLPKSFVNLFEPKFPLLDAKNSENVYCYTKNGERIDVGGNVRMYSLIYAINADDWILSEHSGSADDTIIVDGVKIPCDAWYYKIVRSDQAPIPKMPDTASLIADVALGDVSTADPTAVDTMVAAYQMITRIVTATVNDTAAILIAYGDKPDINFKMRFLWLYNY